MLHLQQPPIVLEIFGSRVQPFVRVKLTLGRIYAFITRTNTSSDRRGRWTIRGSSRGGRPALCPRQPAVKVESLSRKKGSRGWHSFRKFRATGSLGQIERDPFGPRGRPFQTDEAPSRRMRFPLSRSEIGQRGARKLSIFTEIHAFPPDRGRWTRSPPLWGLIYERPGKQATDFCLATRPSVRAGKRDLAPP